MKSVFNLNYGNTYGIELRSYVKSSLRNSLGDITLSFDEERPLSPDKIGEFVYNDKAIYGASFGCGANSFALGRNFINFSSGINVISLSNILYNLLNSSFDNLVSSNTLDLLFLISSSRNSGAIRLNLLKMILNNNDVKETPLLIKDDMMTLASIINLDDISHPLESLEYLEYNLSYPLANDVLTSLANSSACSSVNFDLDTICLNSIALDSLSFNKLVTNIDNSISGTCFNSNSSSSGILTLNSVIKKDTDDNYINFMSIGENERKKEVKK